MVIHLSIFTLSSSSRATLFLAPAFCFSGSTAVLLCFITIIDFENRIVGLLMLMSVRFIMFWVMLTILVLICFRESVVNLWPPREPPFSKGPSHS